MSRKHHAKMNPHLLISYPQEKPKKKQPIEMKRTRHPKNTSPYYQVWTGDYINGEWWWEYICSAKDVKDAFYIVKTMLATLFCFIPPETAEELFYHYSKLLILSPDNKPVDMPKLSTIQPHKPFPADEEHRRGNIAWEMLDKIGELSPNIKVSYNGRI